jgi:hypothetical protein
MCVWGKVEGWRWINVRNREIFIIRGRLGWMNESQRLG